MHATDKNADLGETFSGLTLKSFEKVDDCIVALMCFL